MSGYPRTFSVRTLGLAAAIAAVSAAIVGVVASGSGTTPRTVHRGPTFVGDGPRARSDSRLLWSADFNGPAGSRPDHATWQIETGGNGFGNGELQYYTTNPSNVSLNGHGDLAITARRQTYTGGDGVTRNYTSGLVQTPGRFQVKYGRIEARIKLPAGRGLWPAFWAMGNNFNQVGWPDAGEIDLMENTGDPHVIYGVLHGPQRAKASGFNLMAVKHSPSSLATGFHVYGIDWSPTKVVFTLDGTPYATYTPASMPAGSQWVFNRPFFLILDLAVGGNFPAPPNATSPFPATMLVNWIHVYS